MSHSHATRKLLLASFIGAALLPAQQGAHVSPAPPKGQFAPQAVADSSGGPIVLDIVATGKSHKPVDGLAQQDFTVLDNGQPTSILSFREQKGPTAQPEPQLFFVIDEVNTTLEDVMYERASVKRFLIQNHGQLAYPVSLAVFTEDGMQIQTHSSRDGDSLAKALDQVSVSRRLMERRSGIYGSEELLRMSLDALTAFINQERPAPGRKIILWLSPGWPLLNAVPYGLSPSQKQRVFNSVIKYSIGLHQARMTLYCIDPSGAADAGSTESSRYQQFLKALNNPERAQIGDMGLQIFATQTGGRVFIGNDSLINSINHAVEDLTLYYELTIPAGKADHEHPFHEIQVKINEPKVTAQTINGYYAAP